MKNIRIQLLAGALAALLAGSACAQTGPGAALSFDGVDDYVTTTLVMDFSQGATLEAWIKTTANSGMILSDRGGSSAQRGMGLFMDPGGVIEVSGSREIPNQFNFFVVGPRANDGQWHHVAATWTGTTAANGVKLYLDGAVVATGTAAQTIGSGTTYYCLGWHPQDGYDRYAGLIDEPRIWSTARSQTDIQAAMYNTELSGATPSLAAYWHLNETNGTAAADATPNNNTGTLINGPLHVSFPSLSPASELMPVTPANYTVSCSAIPQGTLTYAAFGWGTNYENMTATADLGSGYLPVHFSGQLSPLTLGVAYRYTAVAQNSVGYTLGEEHSFTAGAPVVVTTAATRVSATGATLNGVVNPNALPTTAWFEWGLTTNYGSVTASTNLGGGTTGVVIATNLAGLMPAATYHFRAVGSNVVGLGFGSRQSFTTAALSTNADLSGLTSSAGPLTPAFSPGTTNYTAAVTSTVTSVIVTATAAEANATIQVRVNGGSFSPVTSSTASGPLALNFGDNPIDVLVTAQDAAFTKTYTLTVKRAAIPPTVATLPATLITPASATLNGSVSPNGSATTAWFEWGASTNYGATTTPVNLGNGSSSLPVNAPLTGLTPGATCHFRVGASNNLGLAYGADQVFTIPPSSPPGDTNSDGLVSQAELDAVLANYWPSSPWLRITNTAGLGTTSVQFALPAPTAWNFTVEVSTNLSDWTPLGSAYPIYQFSDPAATNTPQRHYRLRWP